MSKFTDQTEIDAAEETVVVAKKMTVPAKYAGKYKDGGSDALAIFIKSQCIVQNVFDYDKFFDLCDLNGIPKAKVDTYREAVAAKLNGANGRARMTLRNMLAPIARKFGVLKDLNGYEVEVYVAPAPKSGAVLAAANAKAEAESEQAA